MRFSRIATYYDLLLFDPIIAGPEIGSITSVSTTTTSFLEKQHTTMNKRGGHQDKECKNNGKAVREDTAEQLFEEVERQVDVSDNDVQKQIILDHYRHKALHSEEAFLRNYTQDSVIHVCVDNDPCTLYGKEGGRRLFEHVQASSSLNNKNNLQVRHILVQNNHAKVEWQAAVPVEPVRLLANPMTTTTTCKRVLVGTDWFTFDAQNHIQTQTTVALSQPEE